MTPILGETEDGRKKTRRSPKVLPKAVIYDVELSLSLPVGVSITSGLNAMSHAVETLYASENSPVLTMMAEEGIAALVRSLPVIRETPDDLAARADVQYGAWLCGACLGVAAMALHHKVCHVLGGSFDLPHSQTHAVMLPHVVAYNEAGSVHARRRLAAILGAETAPAGMFALSRALGAPLALRDLGMPKAGIELAVQEVMRDRYWNPRPLERGAIRAMLHRAWIGETP
jgi:maleylacetate reductase